MWTDLGIAGMPTSLTQAKVPLERDFPRHSSTGIKSSRSQPSCNYLLHGDPLHLKDAPDRARRPSCWASWGQGVRIPDQTGES